MNITGLSTTNGTSETTVWNLFRLNSNISGYLQDVFKNLQVVIKISFFKGNPVFLYVNVKFWTFLETDLLYNLAWEPDFAWKLSFP